VCVIKTTDEQFPNSGSLSRIFTLLSSLVIFGDVLVISSGTENFCPTLF